MKKNSALMAVIFSISAQFAYAENVIRFERVVEDPYNRCMQNFFGQPGGRSYGCGMPVAYWPYERIINLGAAFVDVHSRCRVIGDFGSDSFMITVSGDRHLTQEEAIDCIKKSLEMHNPVVATIEGVKDAPVPIPDKNN